ncbi:unnamed protein product [Durusdinium trenchii]|uniref:Uncharacterized protein n=1 Tax=Durusdinium trenchii TaxID=1381693 RepID=A0ABP0LEX9_9DINO
MSIVVSSAASGEELVALTLEDLENEDLESKDSPKDVKMLKRCLTTRLGYPRFRQRLLDHEGLRSDAAPLLQPDALRDAAEGPPTVRLQLVLLDFLPPERERDQEFLAACAENRAEAVEEMLQLPQNPNTVALANGRGALHLAAEEGHVSCLRLLLEARADKDAALDDYTPLHLATRNGHVEVVETLLKFGVEKDTSTREGATPLHVASLQGHAEVVRSLLQAGADKDKATFDEGFTPLHLACHRGSLEVIQMLLAAGANKDTTLSNGQTPLHSAANVGHLEVVRLLLSVGAAYVLTPDGLSPLHVAAHEGHVEVAKVLLQEPNEDLTSSVAWNWRKEDFVETFCCHFCPCETFLRCTQMPHFFIGSDA